MIINCIGHQTEPTVIGNGNPYLGVVLNKDLIDKGASQIIIRYLNGKTMQRGITKQSGYLISNPGENEMEMLVAYYLRMNL